MSHPLFDLLNRLDEDHIYYILERARDNAIKVTVSLVGERVEVVVFEDGHMEVSRFLGTEDIVGEQEEIYHIIDINIFEEKYKQKQE